VSFRSHNDDRRSKFIVLADNMRAAIRCCKCDLLTFALFVQHSLNPLTVFVAVLVGIESVAHVPDQIAPSSISSVDNFAFFALAMSAKLRTLLAIMFQFLPDQTHILHLANSTWPPIRGIIVQVATC